MMNDRNTTRQILRFKDYCFVLEQVKHQLDTRADKEENKSQNAAEMLDE